MSSGRQKRWTRAADADVLCNTATVYAAANFLHMDVSHMKIIKAMFPATVGRYAGLEA